MPNESTALERVKHGLDRAGYTVAAVRELLGPVAGAALARDEIVPALRATGGGSPLESLVRLFWLQVPVPEWPPPPTHLPTGPPPRAQGPQPDDLVAAGLAERSGGELRALVHIEPLEPVAGAYTVSDLKVRPGSGTPLREDHVVCPGGASANLAQLVAHRPVDNVLDLAELVADGFFEVVPAGGQ